MERVKPLKIDTTQVKIWFTSDTHFGHQNILRFCERPFVSVEEMDNTIIER